MSVKNALSAISRLRITIAYLGLAFGLIYIAYHQWSRPDEGLITKQNVLAVRSIGDDLLREVGNNRTPVPSVHQIDSITYGLQFKEPYGINPDKLIEISMKHLNAELTLHSIVSVYDVTSGEMVYGFEINHLDQKNIPCLGRNLPKQEYRMEVSFYNQSSFRLDANVPAIGLAGASLICLTFLGFSVLSKPKRAASEDIHLDHQLNTMISGETSIQLTEKEMQIFKVLYEKVGQLVPREYLMDEVWVKNGVVTSRSLDMYISRLRKKITVLPNLQIENRHGKGYLLRM